MLPYLSLFTGHKCLETAALESVRRAGVEERSGELRGGQAGERAARHVGHRSPAVPAGCHTAAQSGGGELYRSTRSLARLQHSHLAAMLAVASGSPKFFRQPGKHL